MKFKKLEYLFSSPQLDRLDDGGRWEIDADLSLRGHIQQSCYETVHFTSGNECVFVRKKIAAGYKVLKRINRCNKKLPNFHFFVKFRTCIFETWRIPPFSIPRFNIILNR